MMSCHLIPTWHEWNVNAGDIMVTWFASYMNLVTSCWACASCACMHGACALRKMGAFKYLNGLMPAKLNLRKSTDSHFSGTNHPKCKQEHAKHVPHCVSQ